MKNKKAMSAMISVMIMVLIVLGGTAIIWKVIDKTIEEGLSESQSCYDVLGKIEVNSKYTCYNTIFKEMVISINMDDIDVDEIALVIVYEEDSSIFRLTDEYQTIDNLRLYNGSNYVKIPTNNSGVTYIVENVESRPLKVEISPVVDGTRCEVVDSFSEIYSCSADECVPECSCAENECVGDTCVDSRCGDDCSGIKEPDCGLNVCGPAPNGCGWANECGTCTIGTCVSGACSYTLVSLFQAKFENTGTWSQDWNDNGITSPFWLPSTTEHSGTFSVYSSGNYGGGNLISDNIDVVASGADRIRVEFWYRLDDTESSDFVLYFYNGLQYVTKASLGGGAEDTWLKYDTIIGPPYIQDDFRIRFSTHVTSGSWGSTENVWIDDVNITGIIY